MATITSLGFNIFSRFDGSGTTRANMALNRLNRNLNNSSSGLNTFTGRMGAAVIAAASLAPALAPIGTVLAGVGAATLAMGAAAGTALGAYGFSMLQAIKITEKMAKQHKQLSPVQATFIRNLHAMQSAMRGISTGTMNLTLHTATLIVQGLTSVFRGMVPVIRAVQPVVDQVANAFKRWAAGNGLRRFVHIIINNGVPALHHLLNAGRQALGFLGAGFRAFAPVGVSVAKAIERGAAALNRWAQGGGFQRFLANVRAEAPQVRAFFSALGTLVRKLAIAFAGLGPLSLLTATGLLRIVAAMPIPVLQALIVGFVAWKVVMAAMAVRTALFVTQITILGGRTIAATIALGAMRLATISYTIATRAAAFATRLLALAFRATPVGLAITALALLVAAIVWLATKTRFFQAVWRFTWAAIMAYVRFAVAFIIAEWRFLMLIGRGLVAVWKFMGRVFVFVWNSMIANVRLMARVFGIMWRGMARLAVVVWGGMKRAGSATWGFMRKSFSSIWGSTRRIGASVWRGMRSLFGSIWGSTRRIGATVWRGMRSLFGSVWGSTRRIGASVWRGMRSLFGSVFGSMRRIGAGIWRSMKSLFGAVWGATRRVGASVWRGMRSLFGAIFGGMRRIGAGIWRSMKSLFGSVWGATRRVGAGIWRGMRNLFGAVFGGMRRIGATIWRSMRGTFGAVWGATRRTGAAIWRSMARIAASVFRGMARVLKSIWGGIMRAASAAWKRLRGIVASPVKFVINSVIGRLAKTFNSIAKAVHLSIRVPVPHVNFAKGGKVIGPGGPKDDRVPAMLSSGEYVVKASAVKRIGVGRLNAINRGGISGPTMANGGPVIPHLATGGFPNFDWPDPFDWVAKGAKAVFGIGKTIGKKLIETFGSWTKGTIKKVAFGGINLLSKALPGGIVGDTGKSMTKMLVNAAIDELFNASNSMGGGGNYGAGLAFAKSQVGKKYQWGGNGNPSWDCSGFMSAIESVIRGQKPHRRWATGAFGSSGPPGWKKNAHSPFEIGITNAGVGHTAGTLLGQNVECRGGKGCIVGHGARGANDGMFTSRWGLMVKQTGGPGGSGVGRWRGLAMTAMQMGGLNPNQIGRFLALMRAESNGNPNAMNRTDSNARAGMASRGLMQVIPPTFAANHVKGTSGNIFDPLANMAAAARYIKRRYHGNVPGSPYAEGGLVTPLSFDHGGLLPSGLSLVNNGTGRPEPVGHGMVPDIHFHGCNFAGGQREFETMVVRAVSEAKRKGRV